MEFLVDMVTTVPDGTSEATAALPLRVWMTIEVTPFAPHPNDPAGKKA